jgi:hypothetical protein
VGDGAALGVADDGFEVGDGGADGDAAGLGDVGGGAGVSDDFLDNFLHEVGDVNLDAGGAGVGLGVVAGGVGVGPGDGDAFLNALGVVGADDGADAVLEGRDDAAAVGVVFWICAEDEADVEVEADGVAADLDVALLKHVEQADLDAGGEVGELVNGEEAPI